MSGICQWLSVWSPQYGSQDWPRRHDNVVAADAHRWLWCRPARSVRSTARQFTGNPTLRGSTRSFRSRFCLRTSTKGSSYQHGTVTKRKGKHVSSYAVAYFMEVWIKLLDSERWVLQASHGRRRSVSSKWLLAFASTFVFHLGPRWTPWPDCFALPGPMGSSLRREDGSLRVHPHPRSLQVSELVLCADHTSFFFFSLFYNESVKTLLATRAIVLYWRQSLLR
jgi:hypothetical protein